MPSPRRLGLTDSRSRPSSVTDPDVASTKPAIICSVVVLPHPDGPRRETNSPFSTDNDSESTARWSPNRFVSLSRTRNDITLSPALSQGRGRPLSFHFSIPALGPFVALLVDGVPVDVHELRGALADRRDLELLVVDLPLAVHRPVAVFEREHLLELRLHQRLHEFVREGRGVGLRDRAGGGEQRHRAFLRIDEIDGEPGD